LLGDEIHKTSDLWTKVATGFTILLSTHIEADFFVRPREFPWCDAVGPTGGNRTLWGPQIGN